MNLQGRAWSGFDSHGNQEGGEGDAISSLAKRTVSKSGMALPQKRRAISSVVICNSDWQLHVASYRACTEPMHAGTVCVSLALSIRNILNDQTLGKGNKDEGLCTDWIIVNWDGMGRNLHTTGRRYLYTRSILCNTLSMRIAKCGGYG